jgi:AraC-like DNA-binding protein
MMTGLHLRFDTTALAPQDRFEYWRDWCAQAIDAPMQLEPVHRSPHAFEAVAETLQVGAVQFVNHRSGAVAGSWTRDATAAAGRLRLMILAPTPGGVGTCYGQRYALAEGAAVLIGETDGGWETLEGLHGMQVNVPREALSVTDAQLAVFNEQRRMRHEPSFGGLVRPALLGLIGQLEALSATDLPELEDLWISLLTMLVRGLSGHDTNGEETAPARWLQVQRHIRAHLSDPRLSPATIAAALHISRSTLYAALPADSEGLAAEIRHQRLDRARALLCAPVGSQSIAEIGASVGMRSAAQFSRAFHQRFGVTPRQLRADSRAARSVALTPV